MTTAGWSYDPAEAAEFREELLGFLARILPVPEERRVVLTFFAKLLCGTREVNVHRQTRREQR
jgi:hypothetical protein